MRLIYLCFLAVFLLLPGGAFAQSPSDAPIAGEALPAGTLTSPEVFALFNDMTVYSVTAIQLRESVSYYDPNGEVRQLRKGIKRNGQWRVTDFGRICLQMEDLPEKCRIIAREGGIYKKYIVRKSGPHQHSVSYPEFRKGNPLGL
jgi:hypothetical protein